MTKALQMINICFYLFGEKGQWETGHWEMGHFKMFQGRRDNSIIWETGHSILWEKGNFIPWETIFYALGIGPLILWESDHLSSGIWEFGRWI